MLHRSLDKGYGLKPTIDVLIGAVFTVSECSPTSLLSSSPKDHKGTAALTAAGSGSGIGKGGGSGLSAGTDALRLACLRCLEVNCTACEFDCTFSVALPFCDSKTRTLRGGMNIGFIRTCNIALWPGFLKLGPRPLPHQGELVVKSNACMRPIIDRSSIFVRVMQCRRPHFVALSLNDHPRCAC